MHLLYLSNQIDLIFSDNVVYQVFFVYKGTVCDNPNNPVVNLYYALLHSSSYVCDCTFYLTVDCWFLDKTNRKLW